MCNSLIDGGYCLNGKNVIQILSSPVFFCGSHTAFDTCKGLFVTAKLYLVLIQFFLQSAKQLLLYCLMNNDGFTGVADTNTLSFCIVDDIDRHIQISTLIHKM